MIGPQRLSLLDGEVLRREYSARALLDQVVDKIVDAFDFPINTKSETSVHRIASDDSAIPKSIGEAYASFKEKTSVPSTPWTLRKSWSFPLRKNQSMAALVNEALCAWILNASPDGEKTNPLELGWSTRKDAPEHDKDLVFHGDDQDELPLECNYTCMTC